MSIRCFGSSDVVQQDLLLVASGRGRGESGFPSMNLARFDPELSRKSSAAVIAVGAILMSRCSRVGCVFLRRF